MGTRHGSAPGPWKGPGQLPRSEDLSGQPRAWLGAGALSGLSCGIWSGRVETGAHI